LRALLNPPDDQTQERFRQQLGCLLVLNIRHRPERKCFPMLLPDTILSPTAAEDQWYPEAGTWARFAAPGRCRPCAPPDSLRGSLGLLYGAWRSEYLLADRIVNQFGE